MKTNFYPNRQFYTNDTDQEIYGAIRYRESQDEKNRLYDELQKLKENKYSEIANQVKLDVKEFESMKYYMSIYGLFLTDCLKLMKEKGLTQKEFEDINNKYNLNLKYLFKIL